MLTGAVAITDLAVAALLDGSPGAEPLLKQLVQIGVGAVLVFVERVHELRREDLLGAGVHLLLASRETLLRFADRQVADDLGEVVDVPGLDLSRLCLKRRVQLLGISETSSVRTPITFL